ncbi:Trypsin-like peptidase domain-containing protein [Virgibacillus subterraneus]|uniref:Trypsin-like peptidase domain-containing protein n=1 Tax=Virgibacillus subterraneus TaxID=621109 RepID=A0A1H9HN27_9BACI|nr:trypsin-like peptidase domain-containing protein [Virgibacillus subterraneus]SEQ63759.1 Trypsin-like peptidase domain-containing protein [Virgibacillus subterraneus]
MSKMQTKPIIASALVVIIGAFLLFSINDYWASKNVSVNNPVINKVESSSRSIDLKTIIHESEKNVVQIEGQNEFNTITGSGFLYNDKGDIITNAHVVRDADVIYVRTANARIYPAAVIGMGKDTDIAVIRVPQLAGQNSLSVEKDIQAETGDEVIALGSPHGFQNTVTLGIISGTERNFSVDGFNYENVYQISAQITHGNSGGPLINRETGNVIGINSVGTEDGTIGFSIPISEVIEKITTWSNEAQNEQLDFANTSEIGSTTKPEELKENAEYIIDYFFESIIIRDYVGAYTLLGSSMQSENSYSDFQERYIHIIDLQYSDFSSKIKKNNQVETTVDVTVETNLQNKEETKKETFKYVLTIGNENDQLKILNLSKTLIE